MPRFFGQLARYVIHIFSGWGRSLQLKITAKSAQQSLSLDILVYSFFMSTNELELGISSFLINQRGALPRSFPSFFADSFVFMCWNSSWESVHSDKSARCFAPEFHYFFSFRWCCLAGNDRFVTNLHTLWPAQVSLAAFHSVVKGSGSLHFFDNGMTS